MNQKLSSYWWGHLLLIPLMIFVDALVLVIVLPMLITNSLSDSGFMIAAIISILLVSLFNAFMFVKSIHGAIETFKKEQLSSFDIFVPVLIEIPFFSFASYFIGQTEINNYHSLFFTMLVGILFIVTIFISTLFCFKKKKANIES